DVIAGQRHELIEVAFPETQPVWHATITQPQERSAKHTATLLVTPFDLLVVSGPLKLAFLRFQFAPHERNRERVERAVQVRHCGRRQHAMIELHTQQRRQLRTLTQPCGKRLVDISVDEQFTSFDSQGDGPSRALRRRPWMLGSCYRDAEL